jgi:uncharacterized membrane protein YbaN (DUF454 family)
VSGWASALSFKALKNWHRWLTKELSFGPGLRKHLIDTPIVLEIKLFAFSVVAHTFVMQVTSFLSFVQAPEALLEHKCGDRRVFV